MSYYFIKLFQEYGELFKSYRSLVDSLISYKRGELKRGELEKELYKLYELFKYRRIQGRDIGVAQFVYKTVLKMDLLLFPEQKRLAGEFDLLRKNGLRSNNRRVSIKQNRLVELFNKHFCSFPGFNIIHYNHFSHIKKEIDFDKQKELHWIIYLHYINFMVELKKNMLSRVNGVSKETDDEGSLESFFEKCLIDIENEPERRLKEITISIILDFVDLFLPSFENEDYKNLEGLAEKMVEKFSIYGESSLEEDEFAPKVETKNKLLSIFKYLLPFTIMTTVLIFAGTELLGKEFYSLSYKILPLNIPVLDNMSHLPLDYKFLRGCDMGMRVLSPGDAVSAGDEITIEYNLPFSCYLTILCVDSQGIRAVPGFPGNNEPVRIERGFSGSSSFVLKESSGLEFYYIFLSKNKFTFEHDLKSELYKLFPAGTVMTGSSPQCRLKLKDEIYQYNIYFVYRNKP